MLLPAKLILPVTVALACTATAAGVLLEPTPAPEWKASEWLNGDPGRLAEARGKVVLIHFFQMWCPGCNEFSIPLFQRWQAQFRERDDVLFVAIHTVFEGHAEQTPAKLKQFVAEKGITYPVGIDAYPAPGAQVPITMDRYETGGTPHIAIVDKEGELRFSHFGRFDPDPVERFLTRMLDEDKKFKLSPPSGKQSPKARRKAPRPAARAEEPPPAPPAEVPPELPEVADDAVPAEAGEEPEGQAAEPAAEAELEDAAPDQEKPEVPEASLSGSYKLRFQQTSNSCGEVGPMVEVITQITVQSERIVARFSRPFLGIRELTASYSESSGDFQAEIQTKGTEKGGAQVDVRLQMSGRYLSIHDPVDLEFEYFLDERSADGTHDCVIEGRGEGGLFRGR